MHITCQQTAFSTYRALVAANESISIDKGGCFPDF